VTKKKRFLSIDEIRMRKIKSTGQNEPEFSIKLPVIQRGLVWNPKQVELLFDSMMRGFPIGAFILGSYLESLDRKKSSSSGNNAFFLVDGQQRFHAIQTAFCNPWKSNDTQSMLWIDLDQPGGNDKHHRQFIPRLITCSHPWGFKKNDLDRRLLPAHKRREALDAFSALAGDSTAKKVGQIDLAYAQPWDAIRPVPMCLLLGYLSMGEQRFSWEGFIEFARSHLKGTPKGKILLNRGAESWITTLESKLGDIPTMGVPEALRRFVEVEIPVLYVDVQSGGSNTRAGNEERDQLEEFFIRVNAGGTPLQGEELMYSILKSIEPEAEIIIDNIREEHHLMVPSRLVLLLAQLKMAEERVKKETSNSLESSEAPRRPTVRQFRSLARKLKLSEGKDSYNELISRAKNITTLYKPVNQDFRLHPAITASIAHSSPDIFFMLLYRIRQDNEEYDTETMKRIVGVVTAIHWLARGSSKRSQIRYCVDQLWGLHPCKWSLKPCLTDNNGELVIPPPISPDAFTTALEKAFTETDDWNWDHLYKGKAFESISEHVEQLGIKKGHAEFAWRRFVDAFLWNKEILLYAQRHYLLRMFSAYDPTSANHLDDMNSPWDYDHIFPSKYTYRKQGIRKDIAELSWMIGNFRAWPAELNRSDQYDLPEDKLTNPKDSERIKDYLNDIDGSDVGSKIRKASFVNADWDEWQKIPETVRKAVKKHESFEEVRDNIRNAIITRTANVYREWYESLNIQQIL